MTGLDVLQSAQFIDVHGKQFVVLGADEWEVLMNWLEDLEDLKIAQLALSHLKKFQQNRSAAGWLKWSDVESELV